MSKIIKIPTFLQADREELKHGDEYFKTLKHEKLISLPKEFDFYLKKFKKVYKIEKSNSELRYVLTWDDGTYGWDQKGFYIRTLKGYKFIDALNDAIKKMPEVEAFFSDEAMDYKSNNPEFDAWIKKLDL